MKYSAVLISALMLTSCVVVKLSPEGQKVKTISPAVAQKCSLIGLTEAKFDSALGAEIILRNNAAKMGGNSLLTTSQLSNSIELELVAEVYKCD